MQESYVVLSNKELCSFKVLTCNAEGNVKLQICKTAINLVPINNHKMTIKYVSQVSLICCMLVYSLCKLESER